MIRTVEMSEQLEEVMEDLAEQRIEKQKTGYEKDRIKLWVKIQEMAAGKEDGSITLSYLRSGYITKKYNFYMAYHEGELFVEEEPQYRYVDMSGFMEDLEEDFETICREAKKRFIRVLAGETEYLWECYMDKLYGKFGQVVKAAVDGQKKENGVVLYYGGYMEEQSMIGYV